MNDPFDKRSEASGGGTTMRLLHFPTSVAMMLFFSIVEGVLYLFSKESSIPGLPDQRDATRSGDGAIAITRLKARDLSPHTLRGYVRRSEPVVIEGLKAELFDVLEDFTPAHTSDLPSDKLLIDQYSLPKLGNLAQWIRTHTGRRVAYMARFSGGYGGGVAHIDAFPSYNFYYVRRGTKKVFIVPRQYNAEMDLVSGFDSMYVAPDTADLSQLEWLDELPAYYTFELTEGDVLLFNNSACVHKFINLSPSPEIFTLRLFTIDASPLTLRNDILNWAGAKSFASVLLQPTTVRDTYSV